MQVKQDLLQQLENEEMDSAVYIDLVDKYMALWDASKALEREWKKERMVTWDNGGGQKELSLIQPERNTGKLFVV